MTVALAVRARKRLVYDCGAAGMLNSSEIALRAGVKLAAINRRIHEGVRGEALLAPSRRGHDSWSARRANGTRDYREFCHSNGNSKLVFALQVVREFGATPPLRRAAGQPLRDEPRNRLSLARGLARRVRSR